MKKVIWVWFTFSVLPEFFLTGWLFCNCGCNHQQKPQPIPIEEVEPTPTQVLPAPEEVKQGWRLKFGVYQDKSGEWRWKAKSRNGRITGDSGEGYKNKADCLSNIQLFKDFAAKAEIEIWKEQ